MIKFDNKLSQPQRQHLETLSVHFDYTKFKEPEQWIAIEAILNKRDVFVVARSGFGKSLIYQFPPIFLKKKCIIISPLISLMESQVLDLEERGIRAVYINSISKRANVHVNLNVQIIYTTPEAFFDVDLKLSSCGGKSSVCLIAIDECHSISKLSSDFRSTFQSLKMIKNLYPEIPIVCTSSIASEAVTDDIVQYLELDNPLIIRQPAIKFDRPNIRYIAREKMFLYDDIKPFINFNKGRGIVYVFRRADAEHVAEVLNTSGVSAKFYHAGLEENVRSATLGEFIEGKIKFIVSTNALNIDLPDVRVVIHHGMPKNLEVYYQESGRAGRDGEPATSLILWEETDFTFHNFCFRNNQKEPENTKQEYNYMQSLMSKMTSYLRSNNCRRATLLKEAFGCDEKFPTTESCCDICLKILHKRVPLNKMYKEIDSDGLCDVTDDARLVLNFINAYKNCKESDAIAFITGQLPKTYNPRHPIHLFKTGRKNKIWYHNVVKILKLRKFIEHHPVANNVLNLIIIAVNRDQMKISKNGKHFLRHKSIILKEHPRIDMFDCMTKTDDEYYIEDNQVKLRRRDGVAQPTENEKKYEINLRLGIKREAVDRTPSSSSIDDEATQSVPLRRSKRKILKIDLNLDEGNGAGCSHWVPNAGIKVEKEEVNSDDDDDDEHVESMKMLRDQTKVSSKTTLELDVLLDFLEKSADESGNAEMQASVITKEDKEETGDTTDQRYSKMETMDCI